VIPVIAEEEVGDWRLWRRGLDRRVRIDDPRLGEEADVRDPIDTDAAIVVRHVREEPIDRVPGIGALVDIR
jgi:hypothetical protein